MGLVIVGPEQVAVFNSTNTHHVWQGKIEIKPTKYGIVLPLTYSYHLIVDKLNGHLKSPTFDLLNHEHAALGSTPACIVWMNNSEFAMVRILPDEKDKLTISPAQRINPLIAFSTDTELALKANMFVDKYPDITMLELIDLIVAHADIAEDYVLHDTEKLKKVLETYNG